MIFWSVTNQLGRFFMEISIFGQWWRSHQSIACKGFTCFRILCYVLERWIRTQHQILFGKKSWVGSKIHHSTELWKDVLLPAHLQELYPLGEEHGPILCQELNRISLSQFTLHHKFRIDTGRTKFWQGQTDGILHGCVSHGQGRQRSVQAWLDQTTSCMVQAENVGKDTKTRCIGSIFSLLNVKDSNSTKQDVTQSSFYDTLPAYCISKVVVMESGEIIYEKVWKNWVQK